VPSAAAIIEPTEYAVFDAGAFRDSAIASRRSR
jgi:hypothetical protein